MSGNALLIIDVQQGLDDPKLGLRNNPGAENNIARLLAAWRERGWLVIHVQHDSTEAESLLRPELPGNQVKPEAAPLPEERLFRKQVNSAFVDTGLDVYLHAQGIEQLTIAGLTTDHCVSASTRSASDLGFEVTLVSDACAAFERVGFDGQHYSGDLIHAVNLVSLDGEFCRLRDTETLLRELSDEGA